jgi:hypothetical protein
MMETVGEMWARFYKFVDVGNKTVNRIVLRKTWQEI